MSARLPSKNSKQKIITVDKTSKNDKNIKLPQIPVKASPGKIIEMKALDIQTPNDKRSRSEY